MHTRRQQSESESNLASCNRLVEVLEKIMDTPTLTDPILLTQAGMFYKYEDEDLESKSAEQKLLLRMGPENVARIKPILRELHSMLTHLSNKGPH